ncbi:MAG: response regulator [Desulfuromonas sp.]|nr:MAG: response regulator [Desulfuromonas sp.]
MSDIIKNILIVDDEENTRIGLSELLTAEGYSVCAAGDGIEALDCLQHGQYQLVITDINMPRMNGMAFLDEITRDYPDLDVIMMTAFGGVDSYVKAMNLGVYEYLHKPVKLENLRSVMRKITLEKEHASEFHNPGRPQ